MFRLRCCRDDAAIKLVSKGIHGEQVLFLRCMRQLAILCAEPVERFAQVVHVDVHSRFLPEYLCVVTFKLNARILSKLFGRKCEYLCDSVRVLRVCDDTIGGALWSCRVTATSPE